MGCLAAATHCKAWNLSPGSAVSWAQCRGWAGTFSQKCQYKPWSRFKEDLGKGSEKERIGEKAFSLCPLGLGGGLGELDSEEGKGREYKHLSGQVTPPKARGRASPPPEHILWSFRALKEFSNRQNQTGRTEPSAYAWVIVGPRGFQWVTMPFQLLLRPETQQREKQGWRRTGSA